MNDLCFVIQPFDEGKFDKRYKDVIQPVVKRAGLECYRVDEDPTVLVPIDYIEKKIKDSCLCIADITEDNPNIWFEVGYAMACKKTIILTCSDERKSKYPFDIQHHRILKYKTESLTDYENYKDMLDIMIRGLLQSYQGENERASVHSGSILLKKDEEGYYRSEITENRGEIFAKNGREYRCYQIKGFVEARQKPVENERHWLFYEAGQFPDLEVGESVRFKVKEKGVTKVTDYVGAPRARNIYLEDLQVLTQGNKG